MTRLATLLLACSALLASPALAGPDGWEGRWSVDAGPPRALVVERDRLALELDWPGRGPVRVVGPAFGDELSLSCKVTDAQGLVQVLRGSERRPGERHVLELRARRERLQDGSQVAHVRLVEDGLTVARERWERGGPSAVEVLSVTPAVRWAPLRDGPCAVRYRLRGEAEVSLRLLIVADTRGRDDAESRRRAFHAACPRLDRDPALPIVHARDLGPVKPGEHELTWDGRDDACGRLPLGGSYLVLIDGRAVAGRRVRGDAGLLIERPGSAYIGPRWPRRVEHPGAADPRGRGAELDPGRERSSDHGAFRSRVAALGHAAPPPLAAKVSPAEVVEALRSNAFVVIATHGQPLGLTFYAGGVDDEVEAPSSTKRLLGRDVEPRAGAWLPSHLRDLHTVVLWACHTGRFEPSGDGKIKARGEPERLGSAPGLPAALRRAGADVVVSFATRIQADGHGPFVSALLEKALAAGASGSKPIGDAVREAARVSDDATWGRVVEAERARWRAAGSRPLEECARVTCAPGIELSEPLDPARWGDPEH